MRLAGVAMLGVVISVGGVLAGHHAALQFPAPSAEADSAPANAAGHAVAALTPKAPASQAGARRVYPFSIVPGGVTSRAELARVVKGDKVAAAHYAGFQVDKAAPVTVARARAVYVSYRKDGQVYWTSKKVMLAEGETLLSDGTSEIRTRCGNRISETRRLPVSAREPAPEVLDIAMEADEGEGGVQPVGMGPLDDGPGSIGAIHTPLTFASAAALVQAGPGRSAVPMAPSGMPDLRAYNGRPATIAAPQAAQIKPASGTGGANDRIDGGTAVSGRGSGGATTRTAANSVSDSPAFVDFADPLGAGPALPSSPELPPLPGTLAPIPAAPLVPTQPNADTADVPEPGALWLSGIALAALAALRRRTRQAR